MYYLGELTRKPCTRQEVLGSNPAGCKKIFSVRDILSRFYHPGQKPCPGFGTGIRLPGGFCPGWQNRDKMSHTLKFFLNPAGFDPKTSCLVHDFLANSPK